MFLLTWTECGYVVIWTCMYLVSTAVKFEQNRGIISYDNYDLKVFEYLIQSPNNL